MRLAKTFHAWRSASKQGQSGVSLIESMIALVVLGLGIMGLAGMQARMLVESRTANYRAVAVGLIDDLSNRMLLNRAAALGNPVATPAVASSYELGWDDAATAAPNPDCLAASCTGARLAQSDLNLWRAAVQRVLPGGKARVFRSPNDPRQIGIAVAWAANEGKAADDDSTTYNSPFKLTASRDGVVCPATLICHLVYVQP
ncbi:MAG: type IV pilus modification protein PilV [Rhodoferax sp.]|nr:type IV pilus modification protein PilV [Rhodoferax sp.]